jgi:hypothetical protein
MTNSQTKEQLDSYHKEIAKEKDPDIFIDLLCVSNYFAGKFDNNMPVSENRLTFEKWLEKHDKRLLKETKQ